MLFGLFYFDWTILILIPAMLFTVYAQAKVKSAYAAGSAMPLSGVMTGAAVARRMLDANQLHDVRIEMVRGHLTDHYDPRNRVLRLSEQVYHGNNVAAVGVAAKSEMKIFQETAFVRRNHCIRRVNKQNILRIIRYFRRRQIAEIQRTDIRQAENIKSVDRQ